MIRRTSVVPAARDLRPESSFLSKIQLALALLVGVMIGLGTGWYVFGVRGVSRSVETSESLDLLSEMELQRLVQIAKSMRPEEIERLFGIAPAREKTRDETSGESLSTILGVGALTAIEAGMIEDAKQLLVVRIARYYTMNSPGITGKTVTEETAKLLKRIEDAADVSPMLKTRLEEERKERLQQGKPAAGKAEERITGGLAPNP